MLNLGSCPDLASQVLSAQQEMPGRVPAAGLVSVNLSNASAYPAHVQIDSYIDEVLVHHADAVLAPAGGSDGNTTLALDGEEADQVVVRITIYSSRSQPLWSDEKTYFLGAGFADGGTVEYTVVYPAANSAPFAYANAESLVQAGDTVQLDGSASYDPDGDDLTCQWQQLSGDPVTLVDADKPLASFVVPSSGVAGSLVFRLTVSDGKTPVSAEVTVAIADRAPVAVVSAPGQAMSSMMVTLDGSGSYDPDGDALTFTWEQISGTPVDLTALDSENKRMQFAAPYVGVSDTLIFRLTVSDGDLSAVEEFSVLVTFSSTGVAPDIRH